jgi:hypothetical protein
MKTDKELGEIGANAAFKAGVDAKNRAPWLLCVSRVTTYGDSREKTWNEDGPCRTAFAAVVREEIFADVDGMPSVEECVAAEDTGGIEAIRNLMLAAFAKQMEEKDAELEIFKRIRDAKIELQAKYDDLQVTMDSVTMNANWSVELMNKAESKLAAAEKRLAELEWRSMSVKPTRDDGDVNGNVEAITPEGRIMLRMFSSWPWDLNHTTAYKVTHWRPFALPKRPTAEEIERAEFEAAFPNLLKALTPSGMYASKKSQAMWESWQARASEEVKA